MSPSMPRGPDADAFAELLCDWCLQAGAGEQVLIATTTLAEPLVTALHRALLTLEAWPLVRLSPPSLDADFYRYARERHLDGFALTALTEVQAVDAVLRIDAPANTRELAGVDPSLIARAARARAPVQEARLARRWGSTPTGGATCAVRAD